MATFTDVYKQELKSKGVLSSLGSTAFKRTKERLDPRNILFGGSGMLAATGRKIFGKGYQALERTPGKKLTESGSFNGEIKSEVLNSLLVSSQKQEAQLSIIAKNTMNSNAMARDINVMRQNIMKMVTMSGGKASRGADMFFKDAAARETAYESQFGKEKARNTPTPINEKKVENKESFGSQILSFFKSIFAPLSLIIGTLVTAIKAGIDGIVGAFSLLKNGITGLIGWLMGKLGSLFTPGSSTPTPPATPKPTTPPPAAAPSAAMAAGVVGGVGVGGAAATGLAAGILAQDIQKENRAASYASPMIGAMSGDTAFASAIMDAAENGPLSKAPTKVAILKDDVVPGMNFKSYADKVGERESRNNYKAENTIGYLGKYQFGAQALEDLGFIKPGASKKGKNKEVLNDPKNWNLAGGKQEFLNSPDLQENAFALYTSKNYGALVRLKVLNKDSTAEEKAGYLMAAHLLGPGGALKLKQGEVGKDAYGTTSSSYYALGSQTQNQNQVPKPTMTASPASNKGMTLDESSAETARLIRQASAEQANITISAPTTVTNGSNNQPQQQIASALNNDAMELFLRQSYGAM